MRHLASLLTIAGVWCGSGGCHGDRGAGAPVDAAPEPLDADLDALLDAGIDGAAVAPCPTAALGADLTSSGTRLCARFEVAPGGARKLLGFRDRVLGIDCTIHPSSPTTARCLPPMPEVDAYRDPGCTAPLLVTSATAPCGTYPFAGRASNLSCPRGQLDQIFAIGAEVVPQLIYRRYADGTCGATGASASYRYFTVAPVSIEQFAVVQRVDDAAAPGRIHAARWQGDDGSSSAWFLHDELLQTDCLPSEIDGALRCAPVSMGPNTFADSACIRPIGGIVDACATVTPGVLESPAFVLDQFTGRFYRRGAAATPNTIYVGGGGTCSATSSSPGVRYFLAGAEVPVTSLAPYERGPRATAARIQPYAFWAGADPIVDDGQFYDSLLDTRCRTGLAIDESRRCVPDADLGFARLYTDPQSQTPIRVLTPKSYVTWVPNQFAVEISNTPGVCPVELRRVVRRGPERTAPLYFAWFGGVPPQLQCSPAPGRFWDVGPDVAPTDLVPMELVEQ